jgi:hypothetical protein
MATGIADAAAPESATPQSAVRPTSAETNFMSFHLLTSGWRWPAANRFGALLRFNPDDRLSAILHDGPRANAPTRARRERCYLSPSPFGHIAKHWIGLDRQGLRACASFPNFNQPILNGAPGANH